MARRHRGLGSGFQFLACTVRVRGICNWGWGWVGQGSELGRMKAYRWVRYIGAAVDEQTRGGKRSEWKSCEAVRGMY